MAISEAHVGRQYPPTPPYEVSAAKVAEFARALGEGHSRHFAADAVAPPTFAAVLTGSAWQSMFDDPELGLALRRVIHGDQRFEFTRLLKVGDRVQATLTIDKVRSRGATDIISASVALRTLAGEPVCTASATFFHGREVSP
ncbi:MAG: MaoC family dehydratase N-terminal domain-containing protein [Friedmanniella sp.]|jgi:acyl dehydratase